MTGPCDQLQRDGQCTVSELVAANSVSQPAISRHLRVLRDARLVTAHQDGRQRRYRVETDGLLPLLGYLTTFWDQRFNALAAVLDDLEG